MQTTTKRFYLLKSTVILSKSENHSKSDVKKFFMGFNFISKRTLRACACSETIPTKINKLLTLL